MNRQNVRKVPSRRIIDTVPEPVFEINKHFVIRLANLEAHRRWPSISEGNTRIDKLIGSSPGNKTTVKNTLEETFRLQKPQFTELATEQGETLDIRTNWVEETGAEPEKVVVHILDVTHSRKLEKALKESEEKLRAQYDSFPIPTYTWQWTGKDLVLVDFNDAARKITRGKIEEFKGIKAGVLYGEQMEILEDLRQCYVQQQAIEHEMTYNYKSTGETRYLAVKYVFVPPDLVVVHTEDISERKLAQSALERSEKKYRAIFEFSPEAIVILDKEGRVVDVNERLIELSNIQKEEVMGKNFLELPFLSAEDKQKSRLMFSRRMQSLDVPPYELSLISGSGAGKIVQIIAAPVKGPDGSIIHDLVILSDITQAKQVEETLLRHREQLEESVKERTLELEQSNNQLKAEISERLRAEELLKASLKEKETLLNEIHHRVKNNLQLIISLLNVQAKQLREQDSLDVFTEVKNKVYSIALIHEKLYQSKNLADINFGEYVQDLATQLFRMVPGAAELSIRVKLHLDTAPIFLDISQALPCALLINELMSNSLKYAFPARRNGDITVSLRADDNRQVQLVIADNGTGLPQDFDIETADTLGMQIVRSLVKQLRGSIDIDCNHGTRVTIFFQAI